MWRTIRGVGWLMLPLAGVPAAGVGAPVGDQVTYTMITPSSRAAISAAQPTGQGATARVTLRVQDSSVAYVIRALAQQAHLRLSYDNGDQRFARLVTMAVADIRVMDAFAVALQGTGLAAKLASDGETVMIRGQAASERAKIASGVIAGRVMDSTTGAGLGGAQVRVEGFAKVTTVTLDSGNFTLKNVPAGDQALSVRLFGYRPVTRTVTVVDSQRTTVRIFMVSVPTVLSGVVTTATGLQRKAEVGNDITTINVDSVMQVAPISSLTDLLETRVPGLTVLHSSGAPGAPSRIRLRGISTINGNKDPIIIVDGVRVYAAQSDNRNLLLVGGESNNSGSNSGGYTAPSPLDQIDPSSIETIDIFKGPSATAIYGSDAANGVIVVATKHGHAGPTHWTMNAGLGRNSEPGNWPVNYYRFGNNLNNPLSPFCAWNDLTCKVDSIVSFQALNDPRYSVLATGSDQTFAASVSGGVSTLQYALTGSAAGDVGLVKLPSIEEARYQKFYGTPTPTWMRRPQNYQTWGTSGQLTAKPSSAVQVTMMSSLFDSRQQNSSLEGAINQLAGEYIDPTQLASTPLIWGDVQRVTDQQVTTTNALTLSWQARSWLPLTATGGLNSIQRTDQTYIPFGINSCSVGGVQALNQGSCFGDTTGSYGLGRGTSLDKTLSLGTQMPLIGNRMTLALGGNWHAGTTADFQAYTNQLAPGVSQPTSFFSCTGTTIPNCQQSANQSAGGGSTYGWYVQPTLNMHSRFFVTPGFRLDGGSASGAHGGFNGGGLTAFPKIDFSWIAVDHQGTAPLWGLFTLVRPRLAFGYAGVQPSQTDKLRLINTGGANGFFQSGVSVVSLDGVTFVPDIGLTSIGNTQLRPERDGELEGGFDATLWNGRLQLTYSQYTKTAHDAILSIQVAPSAVPTPMGTVGVRQAVNIGVIRNTGTEATLTAQVFESRALGWTVGANVSNNANRLVRLNAGYVPDHNSGLVPGFPLFGQWARPIVSFADVNHNGIIDSSEVRLGDSLVYVGQNAPKYQLNINTGLSLFAGRVSVNATFAYINGLTQFNAGARDNGTFASIANVPDTPLATQAALIAVSQTNIGVIQTVNTFRFNDLSINYTMPRSVSTLFRMPVMSMALQGSNLALRTNYRGKDPNVNAFSNNGQDLVQDNGQIPQPRTWWLKFTMGN